MKGTHRWQGVSNAERAPMSWRHREAQIVYKYIILCHKDIVYVIAARPQERNGVSSHWQDDWLFIQYGQFHGWW